MAVADTATSRFQMGRVARRAFSVIGHNLLTFALLSVVPGIPAAIMYWGWSRVTLPVNRLDLASLGIAAPAAFTYFISYFVFQAAVVHGAVAYLNGKHASFSDCLATGLKRLLPLFLMSLAIGFAVLGGTLLLVVPGVILAIMWSVAVPACVVEHKNVGDALARSSALTDENRWPIFGLAAAYYVLRVVVGGILGALSVIPVMLFDGDSAAATTAYGTTLYFVGATTIAVMINLIIGASGVASIYYELRVIKEGIGPEALAAVFD